MAIDIKKTSYQELSVVKNNIGNSDASLGTLGYAAYADAAATSPVDGTGGSPNSTITATSSSPLDGSASFLLTKNSGASRQGEGVSVDFTIPDAEKSSILTLEFDFDASANFVPGDNSTDSDVVIWVYDVTNDVLIQPVSHRITAYKGKFRASFQTAPDSNSYRLIWHIAATHTDAWTFKFDNVSVSRKDLAYGTPASDWVSYTPTGNMTTNTTYTGKWRRIGDSMEIVARLDFSGAPNAVILAVNMPSGYIADTAKMVQVDQDQAWGVALAKDGSTTYTGVCSYNGNAALVWGHSTGAWTNSVPFSFGSGDTAELRFIVPIVGWSANVQMSSEAETRVVAAKYISNGGTSYTGNTTDITFSTKDYDTHGAWNGTQYVVPVAGIYRVSGFIRTTGNIGSDTHVYVNGSQGVRFGTDQASTSNHPFAGTVKVNAGDTISIRNSTSATLEASTTLHHIEIERISGPASIAASEIVAMRASLTANDNGVADKVVVFDSVRHDTHGTMNTSTGVYTVPVAGIYRVKAVVYVGASGSPNNDSLAIRKNGSNIQFGYMTALTGSAGFSWGMVYDEIECVAGDTLSVFVDADASFNIQGTGDGSFTSFSVSKIGGV